MHPTTENSKSAGGRTLCVARHYSRVARGSGTVINITHVLDPPSGADVSAYQASRAAVSALTRRLAAELPSPMTAVELDPGELLGLMTETEARLVYTSVVSMYPWTQKMNAPGYVSCTVFLNM